MKFSWGWLHDHLQANSAEIVDALPVVGFPIENYHDLRLGEYFRVVKIAEISSHPNADKLKVCAVFDGLNTRQIVCGDPTIRVGQITVLALPGAVLPGGVKIKHSKIRDVESGGMLCGAEEISILDAGDGVIDLEDYTQEKLEGKVGIPADEILHPDGPEWNIEVTFNRGDVLSVHGVAREIAAYHAGNDIDGITLRDHADQEYEITHNPTTAYINNQLPQEVCQAIVSCRLELRQDARTPNWIRRRLRLQGIAPKLWPVDLTNYVAHDIGHPLHAFDADKIQGTLVARFSKDNEQIELLSSETLTLKSGVPIFADDAGPVSIIGVMGGLRTACNNATRQVLLEASCLDRDYFCAHRPDIESHACKLFARGVNASGARDSIVRACQILGMDIATRSEIQAVGDFAATTSTVSIDHKHINQLIGQEVPIKSSLTALGFTPVSISEGSSSWHVPSWRKYDVRTQEDIAEEVARIYGYNKIATSELQYSQALIHDNYIQQLRTLLVAHGLHEVMHSSLAHDGCIKCQDDVTLRETNKQLRSSLIPGLYKACEAQSSRRVSQWNGMFEIGSCFSSCNEIAADYTLKDGNITVHQYRNLGILLNPEADQDIDRYLELVLDILGVQVMRSDAELPCFAHPGIGYTFSALDSCGIHGWIGAIHPQYTYPDVSRNVIGLELYLPITHNTQTLKACKTRNCSQSWRDLTFVFDGHPRDLCASLKSNKQQDTDVAFLSHYDNKVTLRILISIEDATQKNIEQIVEKYVQAAKDRGARLA